MVENCGFYITCEDCIGISTEDGDPYCGWCILTKRFFFLSFFLPFFLSFYLSFFLSFFLTEYNSVDNDIGDDVPKEEIGETTQGNNHDCMNHSVTDHLLKSYLHNMGRTCHIGN